MKRPDTPGIARATGLLALSLVAVSVWSEDIPRAPDAPRPLSPRESAERFELPPGFRIDLVASEPLLADPTGTCFDHRGRLFVCELHGYNLDGHYDVARLNRAGVLDREVRRIPAGADAQALAAGETYGTVKLLEDDDGDGRMDRARVWADRLPPCYGLVAAREGVIVVCAPDIVYLADPDGEGEAEVRETLFSGFGVDELWTRINTPLWGPDNWIYVASGHGSGGAIEGPGLEEDIYLGNTAFRLKPDGSALEPVTGGTGGFGQALTDWGDRFLLTNSSHALYATPLPRRYVVRNPYIAGPGAMANAADYVEVYPASRPHPWRLQRSQSPEWVQFYGTREATANGYFTASCAPLVYRAAAFPPEYRGDHFSCECSQNLVHRASLERDGAGFKVRRRRGDEKREFLTSTDTWFRPVALTTGPEGALYITDMYREIIEDYSAIPRYLQQQYGLIEGRDRGRIWRVSFDGASPAAPLDLAAAPAKDVVGALADENAWRRQTAQNLLVGRGQRDAVPLIERLFREAPLAQARLHALYTLDGLKALSASLVETALGDAHYGVRFHALRLAERWLDSESSLRERTLAMVDDPDPRVRLQLALTLGEVEDDRALDALAGLALRHGDERWMEEAILSSVASTSGRLLERLAASLLESSRRVESLEGLPERLASIVGARRDREEIARCLATIARLRERARPLQVPCLEGLLEGLRHEGALKLESSSGIAALHELLGASSGEVRLLAFRLARVCGLEGSTELEAVFARARDEALDDARPVAMRKAALALLANAPPETLEPVARELFDARHPTALQIAAVRALSALRGDGVVPVLLSEWQGASPDVRKAVMEEIFSRQERLDGLLAALEQDLVQPGSLDGFQRLRLLENPDPNVRTRSRRLLARDGGTENGISALTGETLARFEAALAEPRDPERGRVLFSEHCSPCHRLGEEGHDVGPPLSGAINRSDAALLLELLYPSLRITPGYTAYVAVTRGGEVSSGVLAAETATSITLRGERGVETRLLRRDIAELTASSRSMMPDDLGRSLAPRDAADLLEFVRRELGPAAPAKATLFEDEPGFVEALVDGGGEATLVASDPSGESAPSGGAFLSVSPPQRYSNRIEGWRFPIRERPGPGEYRYLRLLWRSRGGRGVLVELAADGAWPPPDSPARRYYSGENTTAWKAHRVSTAVPREWTAVTVDLWKDCGEFTLTGIAPTAMGAPADFDRIELYRGLDAVAPR